MGTDHGSPFPAVAPTEGGGGHTERPILFQLMHPEVCPLCRLP